MLLKLSEFQYMVGNLIIEYHNNFEPAQYASYSELSAISEDVMKPLTT